MVGACKAEQAVDVCEHVRLLVRMPYALKYWICMEAIDCQYGSGWPLQRKKLSKKQTNASCATFRSTPSFFSALDKKAVLVIVFLNFVLHRETLSL